MVGRGVLLECLDSPTVGRVLVVNRAPIDVDHPKSTEVIRPNLADPYAIQTDLTGYNALYFCAGVSAINKREAEYSAVTYDLTLAFAHAVLALNADVTVCYVSGDGTDSSESSRQMWARVKGKTENALLAMPFKAAYMFRPGIIRPMKDVRAKTKSVNRFYAEFSPLLALISLVFPHSMTSTVAIGRAMIVVTADGYEKDHLGNRDMNQLGQSAS